MNDMRIPYAISDLEHHKTPVFLRPRRLRKTLLIHFYIIFRRISFCILFLLALCLILFFLLLQRPFRYIYLCNCMQSFALFNSHISHILYALLWQ